MIGVVLVVARLDVPVADGVVEVVRVVRDRLQTPLSQSKPGLEILFQRCSSTNIQIIQADVSLTGKLSTPSRPLKLDVPEEPTFG